VAGYQKKGAGRHLGIEFNRLMDCTPGKLRTLFLLRDFHIPHPPASL
jgi:hypothetical protein